MDTTPDANAPETPHVPAEEAAAVTAWLGARLGVSREIAQQVPADVIAGLIADPRAGMTKLFEHLGRGMPNAGKLNQRERELTQTLSSARAAIAERVAKAQAQVTRTPEVVTDDSAARLDRVIEASESAFLAFEQRLRANAAQMQMPDYLHMEHFYGCFEAERMNRQNADRNIIRRRAEIAAGRANAEIALANPYYFFYDLQEGRVEGFGNTIPAAAFSPVERVMHLRPDRDPTLVTTNLVKYHEMRHATQDANARRRMQTPDALRQHNAFYTCRRGERPRIIVTEEASAYGYEMEALNILLRGKLQEGRIPPVNEVMRDLGCIEEERPMVEVLLTVAGYYFPEGMRGGGFSERFVQFMKQTHQNIGQDVYVMTTTGRLQLMQ